MGLAAILIIAVVPALITFVIAAPIELDNAGDRTYATSDAFWASFCLACIWPIGLLWIAVLYSRRRDHSWIRPSRQERKAAVRRKVAEHALAEAQALKEREQLLGIGGKDDL